MQLDLQRGSEVGAAKGVQLAAQQAFQQGGVVR